MFDWQTAEGWTNINPCYLPSWGGKAATVAWAGVWDESGLVLQLSVQLLIPLNPPFELRLITSNPVTACRWHLLLLQCVLFSKGDPQVRPNFVIFKTDVFTTFLTGWEMQVLPPFFWFKGWWLPLLMVWMWQQKANTFLQLPCLAAELGVIGVVFQWFRC